MKKEENNRLTIVEVWQCDEASVLDNIPAPQTAHGTYTTTYLKGEVPIEITAGNATYTLTYQGFDNVSAGGSGDPDDSPPRLWWDGSEVRLPITYLNRSNDQNFARLVDNSTAGGFSPLDYSTKAFNGFPLGATSDSYPLAGITDYLDISGTWNRQRFTADPPDPAEWLTIQTPPGDYPDISADTEWLRLVDSYEQLATGLFFVHERWIPSQGTYGWCRGIYPESP